MINVQIKDLIGSTITEIKVLRNEVIITTTKGVIDVGERDSGTMRNPEPYFGLNLYNLPDQK